MTVCIASLCDAGSTLILISDRMVTATIETEPEIEKIIPIHRDWRVMFSGNLAYVAEVVDRTRRLIPQEGKVDMHVVADKFVHSFQIERKVRAEAHLLKPLGLDVDSFARTPCPGLLEGDRNRITLALLEKKLPVDFLIGGFDSKGVGHIFSVYDPGEPFYHDIPGYSSIGSGSGVADYMMSVRGLSYKMKCRQALYYAFESKYFSEPSPGVGIETDVYVLRADKEPIRLDLDSTIEKKLVKICEALDLRDLDKRHQKQVDILNSISELDVNEFELTQPRKK